MLNWQYSIGMVLRLTFWFIILAAIFVPLERRFALRSQPTLRSGWVGDCGLFFLNGILPPFLLVIPISIIGSISQNIVPSQFHGWVNSFPLYVKIPAAIVVAELGGYWGHRWSHENPYLWRIHRIHHSAECLDWLVNSKAHPLDFVITRITGLLPVYLLGLTGTSISSNGLFSLAYVIVGTFWAFIVHSNLSWRFGWLEQVIATPAFHHWHHANDDPRHTNKNYAAIFPWVDRIYGTLLLPSKRWPESYGILQDK
jgi:sterol desaturase/sphingolipid hydroxylase (fatty acid hydroxylase superfamily)